MMKRFHTAFFLVASLALPIVASAQGRGGYYDPYGNNGGYGNGGYGGYGNGGYGSYGNGGYGGYGNGGYNGRNRGGYGYGDPVSQAINDLQNVGRRVNVSGHDRNHFSDGLNDLYRFQQRMSSGQWDRGRLDNAIGHISHLAGSDRIYGRERDVLNRDLQMLRDFRASNGGYNNGGYNNGGYGGYGGYGRTSRWPWPW